MSLISVVIPAYNAEQTIERSVMSVLTQTLQEFEIIVVDDGSTDSTQDVVTRLATKDRRIKLISQPNMGPGFARNVGLELCQYPYTCFLDADDEIYDFHFETAMAFFQDSSLTTYCGFLHKTENNRKLCMLGYFENLGVKPGVIENLVGMDAVSLLGYVWAHSQGGTISKTEHIKSLGGYYQRNRFYYGEDTHLWLMSLFKGKTYFNFKNVGWYHCEDSVVHGGGDPINEPCFLLDPDDLRRDCPVGYRTLLEDFFGMFALHVCLTFHIPNKQFKEASSLIRSFPNASKFENFERVAKTVSKHINGNAAQPNTSENKISWWNKIHGTATVVEMLG